VSVRCPAESKIVISQKLLKSKDAQSSYG